MQINIKKLNKDAIMPTYGSDYSAGADLYACTADEIEIPSHSTAMVPTGLAVEIQPGYVGLIYARSGIASKRGLAPANKVGVIDSDYRGEVMVALHNHSVVGQAIASGERIAQLVIAPVARADFNEVSELSDTVRGEGGFGSTGKV